MDTTTQNKSVEEVRRERVEMLAYLKAEQRGFEPGHELEDWLEAEEECKMYRYV